MKKIVILTGKVRTGKSTALRKWIERRNDVSGILSPDIDGQRTFMHFPEMQLISMLASQGDRNVYNVGKFTFSKNAFIKAGHLLIKDTSKEFNWIFIDEIGPLELKEEGFFTVFKQLLDLQKSGKFNILILVRSPLVEKVKSYFNLKGSLIITKEDLDTLDH